MSRLLRRTAAETDVREQWLRNDLKALVQASGALRAVLDEVDGFAEGDVDGQSAAALLKRFKRAAESVEIGLSDVAKHA